jgi:hypothetical protein
MKKTDKYAVKRDDKKCGCNEEDWIGKKIKEEGNGVVSQGFQKGFTSPWRVLQVVLGF